MTWRVFEVAEKQCITMVRALDSDTMPRTYQGDSIVLSPIRWWCSGFFPGTLWSVYEYTGSEEIRKLAEQQTMKVEPIKEVKHDHDVGFQINGSFGNGYRLTENEAYRDVMHTAAHSLATRFNSHVGCIRSWDWVKKGRDWKFPVIIDNMMNLELLLSVADMLLARLPEDGIPYWDFDAPDIPYALKNASAGAIMASAFITLSSQTADTSKAKSYMAMAERQLRTLASDAYLAKPGENGGFILKHSVGNLPGVSEVDVPLTYADYYFLEALVKYANQIKES